MAAVSVLKDFTADRGLDDILHSMFNIEDKLQDYHVEKNCLFFIYLLVQNYLIHFNIALNKKHSFSKQLQSTLNIFTIIIIHFII